MRAVLNGLAGLIFVIGFPALLLVDSAVRYGRDGEALVESARAAELRAAMVDATTALVASEVRGDPALAALDRMFVRGVVDQVLSAEWFEESIRSVHAAGVAGAVVARTAEIDLEKFKRTLGERLGLLEERAGEMCGPLFGPAACQDRGRAQQLIASYRQRGQRAIARIPDQILLWRDAGGADDLAVLATARLVGIGLLAAAVLALALVNSRRLAVLGGVLTAGALISLGLTLALRWAASGPVAHFLLRRARLDQRADEPIGLAADGLHRLAHEVVADATRAALVAASAVAVAGVALVAIGRRRARAPV